MREPSRRSARSGRRGAPIASASALSLHGMVTTKLHLIGGDTLAVALTPDELGEAIAHADGLAVRLPRPSGGPVDIMVAGIVWWEPVPPLNPKDYRITTV